MSRIGFDFGTTNSIISYHDEESGALKCFKRTADDTDYVPTIIEYVTRKGNSSIQIGKAARIHNGADNVCDRFKLRLGNRFDEVLPGKNKTAHQAAKDYIGKLFEYFKNGGHSIDSIVMTIPEAWYREQSNYTTRENILTILTEIGFTREQFSFQSEPVAAAAYFCHLWEQTQKKPFLGKLLVIDYGGGTLDVTLCNVSDMGKKIRTLDNYGSGSEENGMESGHAGSAFLARVIKCLCEENALTLSDREFSLACNELEENLINLKDAVDEQMEDFMIDPESDDLEPIFELTRLNCEVMCSHLYKAFESVNAPALEDALNQVSNIDEFDLDSTKIIFVGGFSNFCCVEHYVRKHFHTNDTANDPRFPNILSEENKALAIAKGAALIADNKISVDVVFPYEVGLIVGRPSPDDPQIYIDEYVPLISKNDKLEDYLNAKYANQRFTIFAAGGLHARMYRKIGNDVSKFRLSNRDDLQQIFPETASMQKIYIGISVDQDMIPTLYTKDENDTVRTASLNKILERLNVQLET